MKTRTTTLIAVLSAAFALQARPDVQVMPAGQFQAWDGRPGTLNGWNITDAQGRQLAASLSAKHAKTAFVFDYEHQSLNAAMNGQPAPAAGWATKFEWRDGVGLFTVDAKWNSAAKLAIEADEYRYVSPVILFDKASGRVTGVMNAAITNNPAVLNMDSVSSPVQAALCAQFSDHPNTPEPDMTLLQQLIASLGLKAETTEAEALTAITALKTAAQAQPSIPQPLAAALAIKADGDVSVAVTAVEALKAKAGGADVSSQTIAALNTQLATLNAKINGQEIDALVSAALKSGKLVPATEAWARSLGADNIESLKTYLAAQPTLPITQQQTQGRQFDPAAVTLTGEEIAMCSALGLKTEDFLATKKAQEQAAFAAAQA